MGKYFRTIYLYIVAFATLCMVVAGFVGTVDSIVSYAYPVIEEYQVESIYDYDYEYKEENTLDKELTKRQDAKTYAARVAELELMEKRASIKTAFTYLAVFVAGLPLYTFHVKQINKESKKEV